MLRRCFPVLACFLVNTRVERTLYDMFSRSFGLINMRCTSADEPLVSSPVRLLAINMLFVDSFDRITVENTWEAAGPRRGPFYEEPGKNAMAISGACKHPARARAREFYARGSLNIPEGPNLLRHVSVETSSTVL